MDDFSAFDSILDCAFIVDASGKIVYCNDPAATFCQSSVRRLVNKAIISDLITVTEPGLLPFNDDSQGRLSPTPFIETEYNVPKAGRTGKVQMAVRPLDGTYWLFYLRDVSLEEALHSKYRSELAQKEDYARNLEKLVEARTAELRAVNQTLNAILNSLGQGFFTFSSDGTCGSVYTKACEEILEGVPKDKKAWDVLGIPADQQGQFHKWTESLFAEYLPFDDLRMLGPSSFPHSQHKHVVLEYYPIRGEESSIRDVVVVATDKTAEREAQIALEAERQYASMIVKYMKNKDQFLAFLASVRKYVVELKELVQKGMNAESITESFRALHTLEGEAGTFSIHFLRQLARESQQVLEIYKGSEELPPAVQREYVESLDVISERFEKFLVENNSLFRIPEGGVSRLVELPVDAVNRFMTELKKASGAEKLTKCYQEIFLTTPIEDRLKYFDSLVQSVAEKLGKRVKPLVINGGDVRIFPEPYQKLFSSLVHAFRNSVDHGLESPEEREWAGKDPAGQIRVDVTDAGQNIQLIISDDGQGIDPTIIREKLKEKFADQDFASLSDEEVIQKVALPGFSSRDSIGEFSGRGVGLDALREEVLRMGGSLQIKSRVGQGTSIEIVVPKLELEPALLRSA